MICDKIKEERLHKYIYFFYSNQNNGDIVGFVSNNSKINEAYMFLLLKIKFKYCERNIKNSFIASSYI